MSHGQLAVGGIIIGAGSQATHGVNDMKSEYQVFRPNNTTARWANKMPKAMMDQMLLDLPDGWTIGRLSGDRILDMWNKHGKMVFIPHGGDHGEWRNV